MGEKRTIPDPRALVREVLDRATPRALSSVIHGPSHWMRVGLAGAKLLKSVPDADAEVVFIFSLVHDSRRLNDGADPDHGPRAARVVRELDGDFIHLSEDQYDQLTYALRYHEHGAVSDDPSVGVAWDSDRLNLWRCGIRPRAKYLSTAAAKKRVLWALELQQRTTSWEQVVEKYGLATTCKATRGE